MPSERAPCSAAQSLTPEVVQAMQIAGRYYVDMDELFIRSGEVIADMIGAPATLVTPGCAAALVLGTAACLTGDDPQKMAQLPDLRGPKDQKLLSNDPSAINTTAWCV